MRDEQFFYISTERYALGRQTYIVPTTVDWLIHHWKDMTPKTQSVIIRDVTEALNSKDKYATGAEMDTEQWQKFITFMENPMPDKTPKDPKPCWDCGNTMELDGKPCGRHTPPISSNALETLTPEMMGRANDRANEKMKAVISSSRLGEEVNYVHVDKPLKDCPQCHGTGKYKVTITSTNNGEFVGEYACYHSEDTLALPSAKATTSNGLLAAIKSPLDSEGALGHEFRTILANVYIAGRSGSRAQPLLNESGARLLALIHRREQEAVLARLVDFQKEWYGLPDGTINEPSDDDHIGIGLFEAIEQHRTKQ